jgi:hypothetical protein
MTGQALIYLNVSCGGDTETAPARTALRRSLLVGFGGTSKASQSSPVAETLSSVMFGAFERCLERNVMTGLKNRPLIPPRQRESGGSTNLMR